MKLDVGDARRKLGRGVELDGLESWSAAKNLGGAVVRDEELGRGVELVRGELGRGDELGHLVGARARR